MIGLAYLLTIWRMISLSVKLFYCIFVQKKNPRLLDRKENRKAYWMFDRQGDTTLTLEPMSLKLVENYDAGLATE